MNRLRRLDRLCAAAERAAAVVLFSALVLLIFSNIVARGVFRTSFQRVDEFVPALVLWLALIGSSLALKEARHVKIDLLLRFCPPPVQSALRRLGAAFGMAVMGILCAASVQFLRNEVAIFGPVGWLTVILPTFFALSLFRFFIGCMETSRPAPPPRPESSEAPRP